MKAGKISSQSNHKIMRFASWQPIADSSELAVKRKESRIRQTFWRAVAATLVLCGGITSCSAGDAARQFIDGELNDKPQRIQIETLPGDRRVTLDTPSHVQALTSALQGSYSFSRSEGETVIGKGFEMTIWFSGNRTLSYLIDNTRNRKDVFLVSYVPVDSSDRTVKGIRLSKGGLPADLAAKLTDIGFFPK